jgi:hypothetical protein
MRGNIAKCSSLYCFRLGVTCQAITMELTCKVAIIVISGFTQLSDILPAGGCSVLVAPLSGAPATEPHMSKGQNSRGDHYFFNAACAEWE